MSAQVQQPEQQAEGKRRVPVKTIVLVLLAVLATWFAVNNWRAVYIWPLGIHPITLVIGLSFFLGASAGWLLHSILVPGRRLR